MNSSDFSSLPLTQAMLDNLKNIGFETMTPIQAQSLPHILNHCDVIAQAKTGSGKTAAFGLGVLNKLAVKNFKVQALILCPTRELADQVAKELRRLAQFTQNIKILTLCGGTPFWPQLASLRNGVHIVVGTSGRVLKHLNKGDLSLSDLNTLVLDEADRMLDMGFIDEINRIISHAPKKRQTLLFSATYPKEIRRLSDNIQHNALNIQTVSSEAANDIAEYFYDVAAQGKSAILLKLLNHHQPENVLIFTNTKLQAQECATYLLSKGINALAIHGDLEQYQRTDVMVQFSNKSCAVLVATDVAARGLDIKGLAMVINYDVPHNAATYIHRIGRTGRAGETGLAATLFMRQQADNYRNDSRHFNAIEGLNRQGNFSLHAPNRTLIIKGGKKDKIRAGDILGALTNEQGLDAQYIGKIDIYDKQSYVAIEHTRVNQACEQLKQGTIKGRKFPVWILK